MKIDYQFNLDFKPIYQLEFKQTYGHPEQIIDVEQLEIFVFSSFSPSKASVTLREIEFRK